MMPPSPTDLPALDWTRGPDGGSNNSAVYNALVEAVAGLIRDGAFTLLSQGPAAVARTIVSQLAHVHGLRPCPALQARLDAACAGRRVSQLSSEEEAMLGAELAAIEAGDREGFAVSDFRPARLVSQIAFLRANWRNDGAEGETVHAVCDALEAIIAPLGVASRGQPRYP